MVTRDDEKKKIVWTEKFKAFEAPSSFAPPTGH